jgi:hypothetical protein
VHDSREREKGMRRTALVVIASVTLLVAGAPQAGAFVPGPTPTHEQFVAQLDSVCQPFVAPVNGAFGTYSDRFRQLIRSAKRVIRAHKSRNRKALKRSSKALFRAAINTGNALNALAQVEGSLLTQINTLTPPAEGWISSWVTHLGDGQSAAASAGAAILRFDTRTFLDGIDRLNSAQAAAQQDLTGTGLQACSALAVS